MSQPPPAYSAVPPQPQGGYGAPPPQGYGAPPQKAGYDAPPHQGYGAPPPQGYAPPQQGYAPPPAGYMGQQASNVTVVQTAPQTTIVGGCPICHAGRMSDEFTAIGIILAILFFPLGVLCCFLMMEKRCTNCGASF